MIQFYKPNQKMTGTAGSFWSNYDGSLMASLIKQAAPIGQNPFAGNKNNPEKRVITKLSPIEASGILDAIELGREWSAFHNSENQVLQLKFAPYESGKNKGFSFSIYKQDKADSQNKKSFALGLTFAEARYLKEFIIYALRKCFDKEHDEYKKTQKEHFKEKARQKRSSNPDRSPAAVPEAADISLEVEDDLW